MSEAAGDAERAVALVCAVAALSVVVTCGAARPRGPRARTAPVASPAPPAPAAAVPPAASATPPAASALPEAQKPPSGPLAAFYGALADLENHVRSEPVRVLWLGDSHTAADFWTDAVRQRFTKRFGQGGPGFVHLGLKQYRHSRAHVTLAGTWSTEPAAPALGSRQLDGVFGLGGMRAVPRSDDAKTSVEPHGGALDGPARFEVYYRLPTPATRFTIEASGKGAREIGRAKDELLGISRASGELEPGGRIEVRALAGSPEIFGSVIESEKPGFVLDTLGINGARLTTPLGWEAKPWEAVLARRGPTLAVLAYGTNETDQAEHRDAAWNGRYAGQLEDLVARVRRAVPAVACLIVGPPDRARKDGSTHPGVLAIERAQRATAEQLGCAYYSSFEAMGGEGSVARWAAERPPLAAGDRVHLTQKGYARLGEALADWLLEGYAKR